MVSRRLNGLTQPLINQKIVFHFVRVKRQRNVEVIKRLCERPTFAKQVREVQILWVPLTDPANDEVQELQLFNNIISLLDNLETFM